MSTNHHTPVTNYIGQVIQAKHVENALSTIDSAIGALSGITGIGSGYTTSVAAALTRLAAGGPLTWSLNIDAASGNPVLRFVKSTGAIGTITFDGTDFIFDPALTEVAGDVVATSVETDEFGLGLTPIGAQPAISTVEDAYTTGELDTEAEIIAAVNAQGGVINDILAALRAFGLIEGAAGSAPSAPTLNAISNSDQDGNYTVDWEVAADATSYLLQEDDNASFTSPSTAYSGVNTDLAVTGKANGTYYYRVRASNANGDSAWSSTQSTTVDVGAETGLQPYVKALYYFSGTGDSSAIGDNAEGTAGYDLTSTAYPDSVTGPDVDDAADFDGSTEFLEASTAFNTHESCSILFWFKTNATWPTFKRIFDAASGTEGGLRIVTTGTSGQIQAEIYTGGSTGNYVSTIVKASFSADTWHAFAVSNKQTAATSVLRSYGAAWDATSFTASGSNPVTDAMDATPAQDSANAHVGSSIAESLKYVGALKNLLIVSGALDKASLDAVLALGPDFTFADLTGITPGWE